VQEEKGLDQVRRDWCPLCKDSGRFALAHILSGRPAEDVVTAIHDHLRGVRFQLSKGLYEASQVFGRPAVPTDSVLRLTPSC